MAAREYAVIAASAVDRNRDRTDERARADGLVGEKAAREPLFLYLCAGIMLDPAPVFLRK